MYTNNDTNDILFLLSLRVIIRKLTEQLIAKWKEGKPLCDTAVILCFNQASCCLLRSDCAGVHHSHSVLSSAAVSSLFFFFLDQSYVGLDQESRLEILNEFISLTCHLNR